MSNDRYCREVSKDPEKSVHSGPSYSGCELRVLAEVQRNCFFFNILLNALLATPLSNKKCIEF